MIRNERAAGDSRHARTGKDGAFYSEDGVLLATVDTFTSNVNYNNAKYSVLGDAQEHETANTFAVSLTMSQIVVEDDQFFVEVMEALETQIPPHWNFQGSLLGRNGSEERVVYKECIVQPRKRATQFPSLTSKLKKPKRAWQAGRKKSTKSCLKRRNGSVRYSLRWVMG